MGEYEHISQIGEKLSFFEQSMCTCAHRCAHHMNISISVDEAFVQNFLSMTAYGFLLKPIK